MVAVLWHYESTRSLPGNREIGFQIPKTWEPFPESTTFRDLDHKTWIGSSGKLFVSQGLQVDGFGDHKRSHS